MARRKDGTEFPVDISRSTVATGDGPLVVARVRDLSFGQASETELAKVFDAAPDAIVGVDSGGVVRLAAGCSGFVKKGDAIEDLLEAIVAVNDGETITAPGELAPLLRQLRPWTGRRPDTSRARRVAPNGLRSRQQGDRSAAGVAPQHGAQPRAERPVQAAGPLQVEAVATAVRESVIDYPSDVVIR